MIEKELHFEILSQERRDVLPVLKEFKKSFYSAGGTALALQLGHRDSIDFDFFSSDRFSNDELYQKIRSVFEGKSIKKIQDEEDTLTVLVGNVKISFFYYDYPLLMPCIETENLRLSSMTDIGCMKMSAITGRASIKDYIDLYYILRKLNLEKLLKCAEKKYSMIETNLIMKGMVYFDDVQMEPVKFCAGYEISMPSIKTYFTKIVKEFYSTRLS